MLLLNEVIMAKTTYEYIGPKPKSNLKRSVKKADSRECVFDDSLNYACLETSIDFKAGWEIKQKWQVASDINPAAVTYYTGTPAAAFTYVAPDTELNVGYKYRLRLAPYIVFFFNANPNFKIDRLIMGDTQFNIDQFKAFFYFDIVYYQKALHYKYTTTPKPALQPDPTAYTSVVGTDLAALTNPTYKIWNIAYPGKICLDFGYNTENILLTWKAAINWKDCYKNFIYTLFDFQNWIGDKALWLDYCDFSTDEDFLIWSYNPYDLSTDTGDKTFMQMTIPYEYTGNPTPTPLTRKRPASSEANFYRDCYILDTGIMARSDQLSSWTLNFMLNIGSYFVGVDTLL